MTIAEVPTMAGSGCLGFQHSILNRRAFIGSALAGLSLPALLQARAASKQDTAVIQIWLGGAASQFETYDPKPDAPVGIRGPFRPIATNVPGVRICETLPR